MTHLQARATSTAPPAWDESGWHYAEDAAAGGPLTAQYVLVLDALNFCFWPSTSDMEYDTLAMGLQRVLKADAHAFDADRLQALTPDALRAMFAPHDMPNAEERVRKLHEVGAVLQRHFSGSALELVRAAGGSAVELVRLVTSNFPGFRDEAVYRGRQIFLYKRAQIFVADVWAAYGQRVALTDGPVAFPDIGELTCFADYRIPQLLRAKGVFEYTPALAADIDTKVCIPPGSEPEIEIRAATIEAVEQLRTAINAARGADSTCARLTAVEVDWLLWQEGEKTKDTLQPHHRTLTVFY